MAIERELRRLLELAYLPDTEAAASALNTRPVRVQVAEIYGRLEVAVRQMVVPLHATSSLNLAELLVLLAEAAIHQRDYDTANKSVQWFLSDCLAKNQFYCRMQFARAHCAAWDAREDIGATKLRKILNAIHFVLLVLPVAATRRPQYDFLVYNASVTYWTIARPLMKKSTIQFIAPSLTKIIDALKAMGEKDIQWLARLQLALVHAQVDAKQLTTAAKSINDLVDAQLTPLLTDSSWNCSADFQSIYEEALRVQIHVGSFKDPECQKIVPNVKKAVTAKRASMLLKLQCIKSNALSGTLEAAYVEIVQDATGLTAFSVAVSDSELTAAVHLLAPESIDPEIVAEVALHAALHNNFRIAYCCEIVLQLKGRQAKDPKIRVMHDVLKGVLLVMAPIQQAIKDQLPLRQRQALLLSRRVEAMKSFERALLASKRQQNPILIENVCLCAWNLSMPLLQPHVSSQLTRVYTLSTQALEEIESLALELRTRLHLEAARLEFSTDFLVKANSHVNKGLLLDYGTISDHTVGSITIDDLCKHEDEWAIRAVDIHLVPLKKNIELKLTLEDPETCEDQVKTFLGQLKESKDKIQQAILLDKSMSVMKEATEPANGMNEERKSVELLFLWCEMSSLAWHELRDRKRALHITEKTLAMYFILPEGSKSSGVWCHEKSLMILEVDLRMRMIEILAAEIKARSEEYKQAKTQADPLSSSNSIKQHSCTQSRHSKNEEDIELTALAQLAKESFMLGISYPTDIHLDVIAADGSEDAATLIQTRKTVLNQEIQKMKNDLLTNVIAAMTTATRIGWTFVIENTCIYLWNYHFHLFRKLLSTSSAVSNGGDKFQVQWIVPECINAFEAAYASLDTISGDHHDTNIELLTYIGLGLATIYENMGRWEKVIPLADAFLKRKAVSSLPGAASLQSNMVSCLHLKHFAEIKTRGQLAQNAKEIAPIDGSNDLLKVVAYLEAIETIFRLESGSSAHHLERAQAFYEKSISSWSSISTDQLTAIEANPSDHPIEELQRQMEIYVEIWVRIGCSAFRFQQFRYAIECAERALLTLSASRSLIVGNAWSWITLAEILCSRAILALGTGETIVWQLILASLKHLVKATKFSIKYANAPLLSKKAGEIAWNAVITVVANESGRDDSNQNETEIAWKQMIEFLVQLLKFLREASESLPASEAEFYGDMVLLVLKACDKAGEWTQALAVCDGALLTANGQRNIQLPATTTSEIRTFQAIASAQIGKQLSSSNNTGGGKNAQVRDSVLQAQILRKIAFSSWKDPPAQLRALSAAFSELDGKVEEQSLLLIDLAEWLYTNQFPWQDVDAYLHSAINMLVACQQKKIEDQRSATTGTANVSRRSGGASSSSKSDVDVRIYSSLWLAEKLVRVFSMRALTASTCLERWTYAINAVTQVQNAWVEIIMIKNEVDAQREFEQLGSGSDQIDFDEWKQTHPPKCEPPHTQNEWIAFYLSFDTNADSRFYMPWTKALLSVSSNNILHFTQPVLTGFFLERLLDLLQENGQFEVMLPTISLYQLLFHVYFPQKTKTMEIWLELTLFGILERLNLPAYALPLQNALDLLQVHANAIVKEVQLASAESEGSLKTHQTRNRVILQATQVNLIDKGNVVGELFLRFGFVRQAKTMLEVVFSSIERSKDPSDESRSACLVLKSKIIDMEGQHILAADTFERALTCKSIDLFQLVKWTQEYARLEPDKTKALQRLQDLSKKVVLAVVESEKASAIALQGQAQTKPASSGDEISEKHFDLDGILAIADIKFICSELIVRAVFDAHARDSEGTEWSVLLDSSRNTFEECVQLYTLVGSRRQLGVAFASYSRHLLQLFTLVDQRDSLLQEAKSMAQRAVFLFESIHFSVNYPEMGSEKSPITTTLEIDIASSKSLLAEMELLLSQSAEIVQQEEMTWYRFDQDSKRDVVMKWLHQTAAELNRDTDSKRSGGDLSHAAILATSSAALLRGSGLDECYATAEALALQCARFAYCRGDAQSRVQKRLWTRFTSPDAPQSTWICCSHLLTAATSPKDEEIEVEDPSQDEAIDGALLEMTNSLEAYQRIALEKRDMKLLQLCSYELVQTFGCHRPLECARSLLMYQSVLVRAYLVDLFDKCASPTNVQKLHMDRMQQLQATHRNAAVNSIPYQLSRLYLDQQSDAVKRMSVLTPVDVILATLPPQVRIFTLQFSPDRCFLYAALVGNGDRHFAMARMECVDTMMKQLGQLRERVTCWRRSYGKLLLEYEDIAARDEDFDFASMDSLANQQLSCSNDALEKEFSGILIDMIALFSPLFGHTTMQNELQNELPNNPLILLADRELALLPLEALPAFDKADSISRDLSIQVLYKRLLAAKTQPLRRDDIRIIVDPHQEDPGSNGNTMDTVVQQFTKRINAPFLNWKDAVDHGQVPSVDDWQQVLMGRRGGGLVYVGANRIVGSSLPFDRLMAMNLSLNCHVLLLLDRAENAKSLRRQSKMDSEKFAWELALEDDSYATAALLTLSGINVLLVNQWPTTFPCNRRLANGLLNGLAKGYPIGKALKKHMESTSTSLSLENSGNSTTASTTILAASAANSNTSSTASLAPSSPLRPAKRQLKNRLRYNPVVYGLAYMALRSGE